MCERLDDFDSDVEVVLITFTDVANAAAYAMRQSTPLPVLVDTDRSAYRAYGLGRGSIRRVYGWRVLRQYIHLLRREGIGALERATEDTLQLGGDFVIDAEGTLTYAFWGAGPDDRPMVETLLTAANR